MEIIRVIPFGGFLLFCFRILITSLKLRQNNIPVSALKPGLKKTISITLLVCFYILFTVELLVHSFHLSFSFLPEFLKSTFHYSEVLSTLGVVFIVLSTLLLNYTLKSFKNSLRFGLDSDNLGNLVTTGIFAHSRNPFFVSTLLHFIGISLVIPNIFFVTIPVLSLIFIHLFILKEERFMQSNYGQEYENYCKKVRRYF